MEDDLRVVIRNSDTTGLLVLLTQHQVEDELVQKLTKTYGGTTDDMPDGDCLYHDTSPLLHAARRGHVEVWVYLASALEVMIGGTYCRCRHIRKQRRRHLLTFPVAKSYASFPEPKHRQGPRPTALLERCGLPEDVRKPLYLALLHERQTT